MSPRPSVRLRRASLADLELLVEHRRRMWEDIGGFTARELDEADPIIRRWMRRMFHARRFVAWIAQGPKGQAIGSGALWLSEAQPRPVEFDAWHPYILSMYTAPDQRGRGIASAIVRTAVDYARHRGFSRIELHASKMGRSVYRKLGFERGWEMRRFLSADLIRVRRRRERSGRRPARRRKPLSPTAG